MDLSTAGWLWSRDYSYMFQSIRLRDWTGVEWEFDRVKRAVTKYKREELTTKEIRTWD